MYIAIYFFPSFCPFAIFSYFFAFLCIFLSYRNPSFSMFVPIFKSISLVVLSLHPTKLFSNLSMILPMTTKTYQ